MTTGERMRLRRKQLGYSAEYVAEKLGCSPSTIYRYENGDIEKMPIDSLTPLASILLTSPEYLLNGNNEESKPTNLVNSDPELTSYLEELRTRPEMRMLFSVAKDATKEDVEKAVAIIEALRKTEGR